MSTPSRFNGRMLHVLLTMMAIGQTWSFAATGCVS